MYPGSLGLSSDKDPYSSVIELYQTPKSDSYEKLKYQIEKRLERLAIEVLSCSLNSGSSICRSCFIKFQKPEISLFTSYCLDVFKMKISVEPCISTPAQGQSEAGLLKLPSKFAYLNNFSEVRVNSEIPIRSYLAPRERFSRPLIASKVLWQLSQQGKGDVTFRVGEVSFSVHKDLIAHQSCFFRTLFLMHSEQEEFSFPEKYQRGFALVLKYFYLGTLDNYSLDEYLEVYYLANYIMLDIIDLCFKYIDQQLLLEPLSEYVLSRVWLIAINHNQEAWKQRVVEAVLANPNWKLSLQENTHCYATNPLPNVLPGKNDPKVTFHTHREVIGKNFFLIDAECEKILRSAMGFLEKRNKTLPVKKSYTPYTLKKELIEPVIDLVAQIRKVLSTNRTARSCFVYLNPPEEFLEDIVYLGRALFSIGFRKASHRCEPHRVELSWMSDNPLFFIPESISLPENSVPWKGSPWETNLPFATTLTMVWRFETYQFHFLALVALCSKIVPEGEEITPDSMKAQFIAILEQNPQDSKQILGELNYYLSHAKISPTIKSDKDKLNKLSVLALKLKLYELHSECFHYIDKANADSRHIPKSWFAGKERKLCFTAFGSSFAFPYSALCCLVPHLIPEKESFNPSIMLKTLQAVIAKHPELTSYILGEFEYYLTHGKLFSASKNEGDKLLLLRSLAVELNIPALVKECNYHINFYLLTHHQPSLEFLRLLFKHASKPVVESWVRYVFEFEESHSASFFEGIISKSNIAEIRSIAESLKATKLMGILAEIETTLPARMPFPLSTSPRYV